jgi:hypothetical protein
MVKILIKDAKELKEAKNIIPKTKIFVGYVTNTKNLLLDGLQVYKFNNIYLFNFIKSIKMVY